MLESLESLLTRSIELGNHPDASFSSKLNDVSDIFVRVDFLSVVGPLKIFFKNKN